MLALQGLALYPGEAKTHKLMRCLKSGQSTVKVSYSPPSPQMCSSYWAFCQGKQWIPSAC